MSNILIYNSLVWINMHSFNSLQNLAPTWSHPHPCMLFCHRSQACGPCGPPRARVRVGKGRRGFPDVLPSSSDTKSQPHTGSHTSMANSPVPKRRQGEAKAVSTPRTESTNGCLFLSSGTQEWRPGCNKEALIWGLFGVCHPDPGTRTVSYSLQDEGLER